MGKVRISATIESETDKKIDEFLKKSKFRNKSHLIEEAILDYLDKGGDNAKKK